MFANVKMKRTKKENKIKKDLMKLYQTIADERPHYCTGCGKSSIPLSHSHIIPVSRRKDLQLVKDNITYHCLSLGQGTRRGCHEMWESRSERSMLLDYHKNLEYILETDPEYYFLISE
tara:strand:- start:436 stop:789 length:354 start_codon:yes stop_codon:yes gene_type:complete